MKLRRARLGIVGLTLAVWAAPVASQTLVQITPDVVYGHKDGMALTLDVFRPVTGANGAGILYMVSGGWVSTWTPPERAAPRFQFLLDQGFTVFAVRHGSSPRYHVPDAVSDVKRATRYINLHAETLGVDAERLGVWGGSAGGHLSLLLGLTADGGQPEEEDPVERAPSRIAAVVAYYPPTDLRRWAGPSRRFPALDFDPALEECVSPILHVHAEAPPALLIHGDSDTLVPLSHSTNLLGALQGSGIPTELIVLEGAGHGFQGEDLARAEEALLDWFRTHLLP
jgi:acetyl esterase/lipase